MKIPWLASTLLVFTATAFAQAEFDILASEPATVSVDSQPAGTTPMTLTFNDHDIHTVEVRSVGSGRSVSQRLRWRPDGGVPAPRQVRIDLGDPAEELVDRHAAPRAPNPAPPGHEGEPNWYFHTPDPARPICSECNPSGWVHRPPLRCPAFCEHVGKPTGRWDTPADAHPELDLSGTPHNTSPRPQPTNNRPESRTRTDAPRPSLRVSIGKLALPIPAPPAAELSTSPSETPSVPTPESSFAPSMPEQDRPLSTQ